MITKWIVGLAALIGATAQAQETWRAPASTLNMATWPGHASMYGDCWQDANGERLRTMICEVADTTGVCFARSTHPNIKDIANDVGQRPVRFGPFQGRIELWMIDESLQGFMFVYAPSGEGAAMKMCLIELVGPKPDEEAA